MSWFGDAMIFLVPIVGSVALFTFLAIASYSEQRRKEAEARYRYEFRKKLVEQGKMDSDAVMMLMRHEENSMLRRRREGLLLGGFVTAGVGLGLLIGLQFIPDDIDVWMVGWIPLIIGVAILAYALFFAPRPDGGDDGLNRLTSGGPGAGEPPS